MIEDRLSMAEELARELRQRIVSGIYRPHTYLPSERELAKQFRTSRATVANAIAELENEKLVMRSLGRGTRVLPMMERLAQPRIGIVIYGHMPSAEEITRQDWQTLRGVQETLDRLGYAYRVKSVEASRNVSANELLSQYGAVIFIEPAHGDAQLAELQRQNVPVVVAKLERNVDVCATWADHEEPMRQAVQTFVSLGHRRIGFVGREASFGMHGAARAGYLEGLRQAELPIDESLIAVCAKTDALSGYFAAKSLLELSQDPPTAIVAARDSIAEGVCRAIEEAGLVIGHHVSVIGFDDTTWPEGRQFLTTFREACYEMGVVAAEMLVERIVSGPMPTEKRKFDAPLVLRRSAGPYVDPKIFQSIPGSRPANTTQHDEVDDMKRLLPDKLARYAIGLVDSEIVDGAWRAHRLPAGLREHYLAIDGRQLRVGCPTGVRLRLKTDARRVAAKFRFGERARKHCGAALVVDGGTQDRSMRSVGPQEWDGEWEGTIFQQPICRERTLDLWLPHMCLFDVMHLDFADAHLIDPLPKPPLKWLAFGDSITHGMETPLPVHALFGRVCVALDAEVFNMAVGGTFVDDVLARQFPDGAFDIISIAFGANEFYHNMPVEKFVEATGRLIEVCRQKRPQTPIVLITPLTDMKPNATYSLGVTISAYRQALNVFHGGRDITIVSGESLIPQRQSYFADDVHPNTEGFDQYAQNLLPYIRKALARF